PKLLNFSSVLIQKQKTKNHAGLERSTILVSSRIRSIVMPFRAAFRLIPKPYLGTDILITLHCTQALHTWKSCEDDYWVVFPKLGQTQLMSELVQYDHNIRLQYFVTNSNLHTQIDFHGNHGMGRQPTHGCPLRY
ncbi:hypothetical protein BC937DRAFT_93699, partial [Endogone sp. FLAS-F59071]